MSETSTGSFFDSIVEATGLAPLVAPYTVTRLLVRAGISPREVKPTELEQALPEFERGLAVYLAPDEHAAAIERLRALVAEH